VKKPYNLPKDIADIVNTTAKESSFDKPVKDIENDEFVLNVLKEIEYKRKMRKPKSEN
jgi:hypothetical protein